MGFCLSLILVLLIRSLGVVGLLKQLYFWLVDRRQMFQRFFAPRLCPITSIFYLWFWLRFIKNFFGLIELFIIIQQNTYKIAFDKPKTTDKLMVARATLCLGFFEFEFSLKASVHNGLVFLIIFVCMLQIVCSVLWSSWPKNSSGSLMFCMMFDHQIQMSWRL